MKDGVSDEARDGRRRSMIRCQCLNIDSLPLSRSSER